MNNKGESSQAPKFEIESEPPSPIKLPKPTKLPDDLKQLDQDQLVKQIENELYQPISFNLDCLINLKEFNVKDWQNLVAVSNNKLVAIAGEFNLRITILNLAIKKKVNLTLYPYSNDIPVIRAKVYNNEDFIIHPSRGSLTQWNLNTLSIEKQYQLYIITNYDHVNYQYTFNKNSTLLAVYSRLYEGTTFINGIIYIFSVENSMLLSQFILKIIKEVYDFKFISFDEEERLLLSFYFNDKLDIRDLYNLQHASTKLDISSKEFKTLMDENIYYMLERCLWVQKISKKQWIEYLQKRSQGFDKIRVLSKKSQIEKILQKLISEGNNYTSNNRMKETKYCEGSLVKWEVNGEENVIRAFKKFDSNAWEDVDSIKLEGFLMPYSKATWNALIDIYSCDLLHNDDLAVITSFGLFIWSAWQKDEKIRKIRVLYYMFYGDRKDYIDVENTCFINLLNKIQKNKKSLLPAPDFDFLYECKQSYTEKDHRLLLKELLENLLNDYIEDNTLIKLYRQELLEFCLKFQHYSLADKLCNKICSETNLMKLCGEDFLKGFLKYQFYPIAEKLCNKICKETEKDYFLEKIQLLDVFTFSFKELTQYPQLLKNVYHILYLFIHLVTMKN
ncbi:hypothetical protein C2G38_2217433 [Gigaspora rosea]|uniref:Uncharacterized protein n=1 Tax=Gigaspora rosea TaxID=44941 RepID=A0A397U9D7_9GLOM|nr:hypothetical protein C2G38_2217433 [Gigaspora rosea]